MPPNSPPEAGFHKVDPLPNKFPVAGFSSTGLIVVNPPNNGLSSVLAPNKPPFVGALN
jgi:hypothetical protein